MPGASAMGGGLGGSLRRLILWYRLRRLDRHIIGRHGYWLFILGVNNSGTTLLSNILATHPAIRSLAAEGQLLTDAFPLPHHLGVMRNWTRRMDAFRWIESDDPRPALRAKRDWRGHLAGRPREPSAGIVLEKSPPNTLRARWLQANFRPSRFIAIVRDPVAVCEGIHRRQGLAVEEAAEHWRVANSVLLDDLERLDHKMLLRYEDLTGDPVRVLAMIREFLELERGFPDDQFSSVGAHSAAGVTQGLHNLNAESRRRLSAQDLAVISRITGDLALRLGYGDGAADVFGRKNGQDNDHDSREQRVGGAARSTD